MKKSEQLLTSNKKIQENMVTLKFCPKPFFLVLTRVQMSLILIFFYVFFFLMYSNKIGNVN